MTSVGILCHSTVGGSVRIATQLACALVARNYDVIVFGFAPPLFALPRDLELRSVCAVPPGPRDRLQVDVDQASLQALTRLVVEAVRAGEVDILHFHYALPFAAVAREVRTRLGSSPGIIGTLHGTDVSMQGARSPAKRRLLQDLGMADVLTTVSRSHARLVRRRFDRTPVVIPNFIDLNGFFPLHEQRVTRPRVVHMSNFRPVKNTLSVARAFGRFHVETDSELWLVGDGETLPETLRELRRRGVPEKDVRCFGMVDDPGSILAQTDMALLASHQESFSLAALEAMACGVPVVGTRVGGLGELIDGQSCGALVDPGDDRALAAALSSVWNQIELLRSGAIRRAAEFSREMIVPQYESMYRTVLEGGQPHAATAQGQTQW